MPKHSPSRLRPRRTAVRTSAPSRTRTNRVPSRLPLMTLALEWFLNPDHLPFVVAKEHGFFLDEGLDLSIVVPTVPEESLELVARGKADFGVGEQTNLIRARDHDRRLISIAPLLTDTVVCLMYLKNGPITRLTELRGRRI